MDLIDDEYIQMSDEAIWRGVAEADEEQAWIALCADLQAAIDDSPDRPAAVLRVARRIPSLAGADGLDPWDLARLDRWMLSGHSCSASGYWAAMLVLALWKGTAATSFTGGDLLGSLDAADQRALQRLGACRSEPFLQGRGG